ncbi:MAG: hypothetical protein R2713_05585 [Ilumatobacteraceae bacterium]
MKLLANQRNIRLGRLAGELVGMAMMADTGDWNTYAWGRHLCSAGVADRRRHRRDPAQHPRRARARPAAGAGSLVSTADRTELVRLDIDPPVALVTLDRADRLKR